MMLTTHSLVGAVLALPVAYFVPELALVAVAAGFVGGAFPDLDVLARHRKTLHFPRYYGYASVPAAALAITYTSSATVAVSVFFAAAWLHSVSDIFGGGAEARPWERSTNRAVYDHSAGRWIAPRRWVRYDGAPEDLGVVVFAVVPLAYAAPSRLSYVVALALVVSVSYTVFRRRVPPYAERVGSVSLLD
jgi:hypothetical protein